MPLLLLVTALGTGLVRLVIPPVKSVRLPITPAEKPWTLLTIDAAKSEPGRCGSETWVPFPVEAGTGIPAAGLGAVGAVRGKPGS